MIAPILLRHVRRHVVGLVLFAGLLAAGCDHVTDPDGPNLTDRFGPFNIVEPIEANRGEVDFTAGESVTFTGMFNKQVDWVIEITGQTSGAVKRIEGFSRDITAENARWRGGTTDLPLFRNETVEVALFVPAENSDTTRTTVEVLVPRAYPGEVVTGFEEDDEANIFFGNFEFELDPASGLSMEVPAAEGERFYLLRGTDTVVDNFFVGLAQITAPTGDEDGYFAVPTTVPEDLFFNAFLYNFGTENTIVILEIAIDTNGNGRFDDGTDAILSSGDILLGNELGWSAFSRSVAEFGLTQEQTEQIVAIRPILISNNTTQPDPRVPVDFGIDYITFTAGGPLEL